LCRTGHIKKYTYDEFGNKKTTEYDENGNPVLNPNNEVFKNEVTFTGSITDMSTGLQYMNARYYDSTNGRFLSQDTYSGNPYEPWTQHLYSYCGNNPTNFVDPTGHATQVVYIDRNGVSQTVIVSNPEQGETFKPYDPVKKAASEKRKKVDNEKRNAEKMAREAAELVGSIPSILPENKANPVKPGYYVGEDAVKIANSIVDFLPNDSKKDYSGRLDRMDPGSIGITVTTETLPRPYNKNVGWDVFSSDITISTVAATAECLIARYCGATAGGVIGGVSTAVVALYGAAAAQEEEDRRCSIGGIYTTYNIHFTEIGGYYDDFIEIRLQPYGVLWQPYSSYLANGTYFEGDK
jgi:RHS repeat-associated protein